jgi:hypothetical protein
MRMEKTPDKSPGRTSHVRKHEGIYLMEELAPVKQRHMYGIKDMLCRSRAYSAVGKLLIYIPINLVPSEVRLTRRS